MTVEQCKRLKEMGFPQDIGVSAYWEISKGRIESWHTRNLHMCTEICADPTAEETLAWVSLKLDVIAIYINDTLYDKPFWITYVPNNNDCTDDDFDYGFDTLSDAVYALIEWAYENKLLEA